jgi:hypothetical protein
MEAQLKSNIFNLCIKKETISIFRRTSHSFASILA